MHLVPFDTDTICSLAVRHFPLPADDICHIWQKGQRQDHHQAAGEPSRLPSIEMMLQVGSHGACRCQLLRRLRKVVEIPGMRADAACI